MKMFGTKVLAIILSIILVLGVIPGEAFAATGDFTLKVDTVSGAAGSRVSVKLSLENNPGVASIAFNLEFADFLVLESIEYNSDMGGMSQQPSDLKSPVGLRWANGTANFMEPSAVFATLTFLILDSAADNAVSNLKVTFDPDEICNTALENIEMKVIEGSVTVYPCLPGDVSGDNKVNNKDVLLLMQHLAGWNVAVNEPALDTSGDGKVNNKDVLLLMQYLAGWDVLLHCGGVTSQKCRHQMESFDFVPSTCTEEGNIAYYHCRICNKNFTSAAGETEISISDIIIPAMHTLKHIEAKNATTSSEGNIEYWFCSRCSKYFLDEKGTIETTANDVKMPIISQGMTSVIYDLFGGDSYLSNAGIENPNSKEFVSASGMALSPLTAPDGYRFVGWRLVDGTAEGTPVTAIPPQQPGTVVSLRAVWEVREYNITYVNYKTPIGDIIDPKALKYTVNQGKVNLPNPEVNNYIFLGWYDEEGNEVAAIPAGTTGNITLNGYYTSRRNLAKAVPVTNPLILDNTTEGVIYFAYELGTIENIPLSDAIWEIQSVAGLEQTHSETVIRSTSESRANSIANTLSKETVDSGTWTLSEEWSNSTQINETWAEQHGMTVEEAEQKCQSVSNSHSISASNGGRSTTTTNEGVTTFTYDTKDTEKNKGSQHDLALNGKYSSTINTDAKIPLDLIGIPGGTGEVNNTIGFELGGNYKYSKYENETTKTHSGTETTTVDTTVTEDVATWNNEATSSFTQSASVSSSISKALSQVISTEKGYGQTYAYGSSGSQSQMVSNSASESVNSSSSLSYSSSEMTITTSTYSTNGMQEGKYRMVIAGTAHVFGVVGFDVASKSFFTYTFNVMDDRTYEFLDYTPPAGNFNDAEYSVLPFEIPYEIVEYVSNQILMTEGLLYRVNSRDGTASIVGYTGTDTDVIVPAYISSGNTAYRVTSVSSSAFAGKPIRSVQLSKFIEAIPAGAFKDCTALKEISGRFTSIGAEAFSGCTSLSGFTVSESVTSIGADAFKNVNEVSVNVLSSSAAMAVARKNNAEASENELLQIAKTATQTFVTSVLNSGASEICMDISAIMPEAELNLNVPAISRFELDGGKRNYTNLSITSAAEETALKEVFIESDCSVPLIISSQRLSMEVVSVNANGFALIISSDAPTVVLRRDTYLCSTNGKAVAWKNPTVTFEAIGGAVGTMDVLGNVYVCGTITGQDNLLVDDGEIIYISDSEFEKYIRGLFTVSFNGNGGTVTGESIKEVTYGDPVGSMPSVSRIGYGFLGWYDDPTGGELITEDYVFDGSDNLVLYAHWGATGYTVSWTYGTGYIITVKRTSSPNGGAPVGSLNSGATVYYGDVLAVTYTAATGYSLTGHGQTSIVVNGDVQSSTIYASATANYYTYTLRYVSSNGTYLGSETATYKYGTTNIIVPPAQSGYYAPTSQSVMWNSTTPKTITFTYTPAAVSNSSHSGTVISSPYTTYAATVEYTNRTANSVSVRVNWSTTMAHGYNQYGQFLSIASASDSDPSTHLVYFNEWGSSSSSARTASNSTYWITAPCSTTSQTSVYIDVVYWETDSSGKNVKTCINERWWINIPAY